VRAKGVASREIEEWSPWCNWIVKLRLDLPVCIKRFGKDPAWWGETWHLLAYCSWNVLCKSYSSTWLLVSLRSVDQIL